MSRLLVAVLSACLCAWTSSAVSAEKTVDEILAIVDGNLTRVTDSSYTGTVEVIQNKKVTKTMHFQVKLKGLTQKLVKFTGPGDVKGMTILTTDDAIMYVYLPSYKRVRRIASHVRNQGFLGTDFSPEEMGIAALSKGWKATLKGRTDKDWTLQLIPEKDNETNYAKLLVWVSKKYGGVEKIESYGSDGKLKKTQIRSHWQEFDGGIVVPTKMSVFNHRTGSRSVLTFTDCKVNLGLSNRIFTKRAILRSR